MACRYIWILLELLSDRILYLYVDVVIFKALISWRWRHNSKISSNNRCCTFAASFDPTDIWKAKSVSYKRNSNLMIKSYKLNTKFRHCFEHWTYLVNSFKCFDNFIWEWSLLCIAFLNEIFAIINNMIDANSKTISIFFSLLNE